MSTDLIFYLFYQTVRLNLIQTYLVIFKLDLTFWVSAHVIGESSKAPFIPELVGQAGTFKNPPLQLCERTNVINLTGSRVLTQAYQRLSLTQKV